MDLLHSRCLLTKRDLVLYIFMHFTHVCTRLLERTMLLVCVCVCVVSRVEPTAVNDQFQQAVGASLVHRWSGRRFS